MKQPPVAEVASILNELYPVNLSQDWDVNGLNVGKLDQSVKKILFTVDVTDEVVEEAIFEKTDLIVSHHPLLLNPVSIISEETFKGKIVAKLNRANIALFNAHTNADAALGGVNDALAQTLGLNNVKPINDSGIGRYGNLSGGVTLSDFAEKVKQLLPANSSGVLVSGDLQAIVATVAVCGGAGDSLLAEVRELAVDVYLTADLRHHPVQDNKEMQGPALISVSHWASEWPWLERCQAALNQELSNRGFSVESKVSKINTDPWDAAL